MTRMHKRFVVKVYGEKKPLLGNERYYAAINEAAVNLSEKMGEPYSFHSKLLDRRVEEICEIASPSEEYAKNLASTLRELNMYREVTFEKQDVDLDKLANKREESNSLDDYLF